MLGESHKHGADEKLLDDEKQLQVLPGTDEPSAPISPPLVTRTRRASSCSSDWRGEQPAQSWFFAPGTLFSSSMTLANSAIGAGILSFPYAFKVAGVAAGITITLSLCMLMGFALQVIARCCATNPQLRSYGDVVRFYFEERYGKRAVVTFDMLMIFYVFGACVGYLMIIYDMLHPVLQEVVSLEDAISAGSLVHSVLYPDGFGQTTLSRACLIGVPAGCFVLPLSLLRDISSLSISSTFAVIAVFYLSCVVLAKSGIHLRDNGFPSDDVKWVNTPLGIAIAIPLTCFAFQCQIQVPPIYAAMQPRVQSCENFNWVIICAYSICLALYVPVGCFGYFQFLDDTPHDILENKDGVGYSIDDTCVLVARVAIMCSSIGAYPLNHYPAREAFYKLLSNLAPDDETQMSKRFLISETFMFFALSYLLAVLIHDLSSVFDILGSTAAVLVIFIVPSQLARHLSKLDNKSLWPSSAMFVLGCAMCAVCSIVAVLNIAAPSVVNV